MLTSDVIYVNIRYMARTTVNIDDPILADLRTLQAQSKKSLGRLISELVAIGLAATKRKGEQKSAFHWTTKAMRARVDLTDKEAVRAALENDDGTE